MTIKGVYQKIFVMTIKQERSYFPERVLLEEGILGFSVKLINAHLEHLKTSGSLLMRTFLIYFQKIIIIQMK